MTGVTLSSEEHMKKVIGIAYCIALLLTVLIVPWKRAPRQIGGVFGIPNQTLTQKCGYSFLFSPSKLLLSPDNRVWRGSPGSYSNKWDCGTWLYFSRSSSKVYC